MKLMSAGSKSVFHQSHDNIIEMEISRGRIVSWTTDPRNTINTTSTFSPQDFVCAMIILPSPDFLNNAMRDQKRKSSKGYGK
mmetsp:Transcript_23043/g.47858  ORF Transcript_23043/g.47858 Transcript_23043/m.47858 type:complete len:82 (+) Transcript_23043:311-556(+)